MSSPLPPFSPGGGRVSAQEAKHDRKSGGFFICKQTRIWGKTLITCYASQLHCFLNSCAYDRCTMMSSHCPAMIAKVLYLPWKLKKNLNEYQSSRPPNWLPKLNNLNRLGKLTSCHRCKHSQQLVYYTVSRNCSYLSWIALLCLFQTLWVILGVCNGKLIFLLWRCCHLVEHPRTLLSGKLQQWHISNYFSRQDPDQKKYYASKHFSHSADTPVIGPRLVKTVDFYKSGIMT